LREGCCRWKETEDRKLLCCHGWGGHDEEGCVLDNEGAARKGGKLLMGCQFWGNQRRDWGL
jgi:hypothetical protein